MRRMGPYKDFDELLKEADFLFRYRPFNENSVKALEENKLYFSTPEHFNDPYDALIHADPYKIVCNMLENIDVGMESYLEKLKVTNSKAAFVASQIWNGDKRSESLEWYVKEIWSILNQIKEAIRANAKIICLSEKYDSMLMWSHYADNHNGFSIMYDKKDLINAKRFSIQSREINNNIRVEPIQYVTEQVDLTEEVENFLRNNVLPTMEDIEVEDGSISIYKLRDIITQKSEEWSYEKEWRVIPRIIDLESESPLAYIECKPKAIILGAQCKKEEGLKLIDIAEAKGIPVYAAHLNEFTPYYHIEICPIELICE